MVEARTRAAAACLLAFAGLFAGASLAHPLLPEDPAAAAPWLAEAAWFGVHGALLAGFLAAAYAVHQLRGLTDQGGLLGWLRRFQVKSAAYAAFAGLLFLGSAMVAELFLLPPLAAPAQAGDAVAAAEFARLFEGASVLFHLGLFVFAGAALRLTRLLRQRTPWWFRLASTVGLFVAALASLAALPFPIPLTFFLGAPAVLLVAAWAALLGLLLLVREPAPRGSWGAWPLGQR